MTTTADNPARRATGPFGFFRDLKTARKLLASFLVLIAIMTGIGLLGLSKLATVNTQLDSMYHNRLVAVDTLGRVEARFEALRFRLVDYTIAPTPDAKQRILTRIGELDGLVDDALATFKEASTSADHSGYDRIVTDMALYRQVRDTELLPLAQAGRVAEFVILHEERITPLAVSIAEAIDLQIEVENDEAEQALTAAEADYSASLTTIVGALVVGAVLGLVMALTLGRLISRPLARTVEVLQGVAAGRLDRTLDVDTRDEVGDMARALNEAIDKIGSAMRGIGANAQTLAAASEELSATSGQMSSNAEESAAQAGAVSAAAEQVSSNVQTVAAGTEEMGASIREIATNAAEASAVAARAVTAVETTS
ncbi:HAMP domain-containing protein, partial [Geodermatophilus pulveris]